MTVQEFLDNALKSDIRMPKFFLPKIINEGEFYGEINYMSVLDKYSSYLKQYLMTMLFSVEEARKYRYNPKFLARDLYGTTEYWWTIIYANQLYSSAQFDFTETLQCQVFSTDGIQALITLINANNEEVVRYNNEASADRKAAQAVINNEKYEAAIEESKRITAGYIKSSTQADARKWRS